MRILVAALIAMACWAAGVQPAAAAPGDGDWLAVVRIHPQPSVTGPEILLGEIAAVETDDPQLREQLAGLSVGRAALPGYGRELNVGTMRVRLRQAGFPERLIHIDAPDSRFQVLTRAQTIGGQELAAIAEAAVRANADRWLQELGGGSLAFACPIPDGLTLVDGRVQVSAERVSGSPPGPIIVTVVASVNGIPQRTITVRCDTRWLAEVWVVQTPVVRHQVLDTNSVALETREFTSVPRGLVPASEDPAGWRAIRPLSPGTVLAGGTVERVPLVWKGRAVTIAAQAGPVWVSAPGVALEDGRLGEVVRVQNSVSGYVLLARVVDVDAVEALVP
ncbi:MAG: flagella basal body P-ring formation protein FlgA [Firmicutes bacterium ZCTH02-B6]|nr:MAG: flagella basal body P-ring formation protein FlgA [Firmicutes bacterium ZCTH02-B6]